MPPNKLSTEFSPSGKVAYATTNYVAFVENDSVHADFHPLMDFLKISPISYALTASPTIYAEIVQEMWSTADCSSTRGGIKCTIKGKSYILTPSVINEALHFPDSNFENIPTTGEIISMLKAVNYAGKPWFLGRINTKNFRKEWSYFFDTLSKVFSGRFSSFDCINLFVLRIAYSLLFGKRIDIGRLLLDEFAYKFGPVQNRDQVIYYARFLMIIANYLCKDLSIEDRNDTLPVPMQSKRLFASLVTKKLNAEVQFVLPEHVQVQVSSLYGSPSPTSSLLLPPIMEDVKERYTSPAQVALLSPHQSGTVAATSVSHSGKRKKTTLPSMTKDGNDETETAPEVHPPQKKKGASNIKPASSHFVVDQEMPPTEAGDAVPVVELPSSPEDNKPKHDLLLLEPAREQGNRQLLMNAASVLKSQLVARLTSHGDGLSTQEMMTLADKCYRTLEGLGDNYASFRREISKLIAQNQELASATKKKKDWNECDIKARHIHQAQYLIEVQQRLSNAHDKLSTMKTHEDSLKIKKEELTGALLKLTEELNEVEEAVKTLTAETDQCKEAHSVAEVELRKLEAEKEEAHVAFKAINDQYNAAKKEFERVSDHLRQLVRK